MCLEGKNNTNIAQNFRFGLQFQKRHERWFWDFREDIPREKAGTKWLEWVWFAYARILLKRKASELNLPEYRKDDTYLKFHRVRSAEENF